jgi:FAD:protein FMN transferase
MPLYNFPIKLVVCSLLLASGPLEAEWLRESQNMMGTRITVMLWHDDITQGRELINSSMAEFKRIENAMSTYIEGTQIWEINAYAAARPVAVSPELIALLESALKLSTATSGAFDITYDSVGDLYDFRLSKRPDAKEIAARIDKIDYHFVELDQVSNTVRFLKAGVRINLGGIAKGYAVERVITLLREQGVLHASATAGGDTRILGDRRGSPWIIGIRNPDDDQAIVTRLPIIDEAVSTSGDYERFFIEDGKRYHHILNPVSGVPTDGVRSVTILGPDGTMTDGLSTSVFVLGVKAGIELIERLPAYEAVIIDANRQMVYSSGLLSQ